MRRDDRVWKLIPEHLRRAVDSCWVDSVNGSVWIILLPGWTAYNGRCMHLATLDEVRERCKTIREV